METEESSITTVPPVNEALDTVKSAFALVGATIGALAPPQLAQLHLRFRAVEQTLEKYIEYTKSRLLQYAQTNGERITEKGSLAAPCGQWLIRAQPWRTDFEAKKIEALLRAKGADPSTYMDMKITYVVNEDKARKILTDDEMELCRYDLKYVLKDPEYTGDKNE